MTIKLEEKITTENHQINKDPLPFTSFLIKVASRCNLNCSYCYMYKHADQSWKDKPRLLSDHHQDLLVKRLEEYVTEKKLKRILILYHGGEPLLFGANRIANLTHNIRKAVEPLGCQADFSMQTNGLLITEKVLEKFEELKIGVSISIDGPKEMHDTYRLDHRERSSFDKVYNALVLLKRFPKIFSGCIAVVNPNCEPRELIKFFDENQITGFSFLLPDAHYLNPPQGKQENPDLYKDWLIKAFDCWFDEFPHLKIRFFEEILLSFLGYKDRSDSFGLGHVSLLNIETDGTYHDLDVLKITEQNYSYLEMGLETNPIRDAERSPKIENHRLLLTKEGLSETCLACPHVDICGGGAVPHRFSKDGYLNPTIYCEEMFALIDHVIIRLAEQLRKERAKQGNPLLANFAKDEMQEYWNAKTSKKQIDNLQEHVAKKCYSQFQSICAYAIKNFPQKVDVIKACQQLSFSQLKPVLLKPTVYAWLNAIHGQSVGAPICNIDGKELPADPDYFEALLEFIRESAPQDFIIQPVNKWFDYSLGANIQIHHQPTKFQQGLKHLQEALNIVKNCEPDIYNEMLQVSPYIQMVSDNTDPNKDISFSDETLPGTIFIGVWKGEGMLSTFMVAASIIHEHLHQKLYLLQQRFELFFSKDALIYSPWPKKFRPPVAALHAVFVFTHVARFWSNVIKLGLAPGIAEGQLRIELERLKQCTDEIQSKVQFTKTGQLFFDCLLGEQKLLYSEK